VKEAAEQQPERGKGAEKEGKESGSRPEGRLVKGEEGEKEGGDDKDAVVRNTASLKPN
jgi:hypothetical protein